MSAAESTRPNIAHGSGQMRAQSFSIQVSTRDKCNAGCKFCISRTTPGTESLENPRNIQTCDIPRLRVGLSYAKHLGATHTILTSRADPTQEEDHYLTRLAELSRGYLPLCDMHTNGFLLHQGRPKEHLLKRLADAGLTHITFSIASVDAQRNQELMIVKQSALDLIPRAVDLGLLVRASLVINGEGVRDVHGIMNYIQTVGNLGAHMVVIREVWIPEVYGQFSKGVFEWNTSNRVDIGKLQEEFFTIAQDKSNRYGLQLKDPLPWGTPVFVVGGNFHDSQHGVNVTFARCEEANVGLVMKSIVHKPNGHGYRNWDHNGDILY